MDSLEFTVQFIQSHGLRSILLAPRLKRPPVGKFPTTTDPDMIRAHVRSGGNVGILGGPIAILDFDNVSLMNQMFLGLRWLEPTVRTGSDKFHCYVRSAHPIPARMRWKGEPVGEVQRGENQYVVCPPSIHPNGQEYVWRISNPTDPIPFLPDEWTQYLNNDMSPEVPDFLKQYVGKGMPEVEEWDGPPKEVLLELARQMPRSKTRRYGIKFQCPACHEEGHDKSHDNAIVFNDGHWACAYAPGSAEHKRAIGKALGVVSKTREHAKEAITDEEVEAVKKLAGLL